MDDTFHCPSWTGHSSPKSPPHCPCCNHPFNPNPNPNPNPNTDHPLYASDEFRMYNFKVRRCPSARGPAHDWTGCPYLHPGEKARRRDPRKFHYSSELCPDFKKTGKCSQRDACKFAHGVFEMWLHPEKYRTELCRDGTACTRKVCFFAHSVGQLRLPGEGESDPVLESMHTLTMANLLSVIIDDMRRASVSGDIGKNRTLCGFDKAVEVPDIRWVSDLVDF